MHPGTMAKVFISYRRDDCAAHAGRLCDRLARGFGQESVFMDVDAIEPGIDFSARIAEAIGACLVVIVLIGDDWLDIADAGGRRRLDDPADLVRHEVAAALRRDGIRVIPVLVEGAQMPPANRLPDDLKTLASRNALELSDAGWRYDVERLIKVVERVVGVPAGGSGGSGGSTGGTSLARSPLALAGGALTVVLALVVAALVLTRDGDPPAVIGSSTEDTTQTQTRPPASTGADAPILLGTRPNGITSANGAVWVVSNNVPELVVLDTKTGEVRTRVKIGLGGSAVTAGFGSVWALNGRQRLLFRLTRAGALSEKPTPIPVQGKPVAVVAGGRAIWVGVRNEGTAVGTLVRIDPTNPTLQQLPIEIRGGVQDIAFGKGAVWVTTTSGNNVVRVDAKTMARKAIRVGGQPSGVAVGQGAVWVANSRDDTISRIDPRTLVPEVWAQLRHSPTRVTTGGGSVWSTAKEADQLIRIDPDTPNEPPEEFKTGRQPFALDVIDRSNVWVTLLNGRGVQRVRFDPR